MFFSYSSDLDVGSVSLTLMALIKTAPIKEGGGNTEGEVITRARREGPQKMNFFVLFNRGRE